VRWTNGQATVFFDDEHRPIRMVGTGRDITDRKVAEIERDRLLELERQATLMREAFIGVMSHELRTPITTILGGSRLLADHRDTLPPDTVTELFGDIAAESDRLYRLVEDLLVLTRSERGDLDRRDEPILLGQVIARLAPEFAARAGEPIDVSGTVRLPMGEGDETYVEQILRNLVGNAIKFSPPGSRVAIVAEATDHEVLVRVLDRGPGVAAQEAERVFDVFYRSPRTRTRTAGSGIGLFVAKRLVEAMNGRIWARPREGGGAEFGFALRRHVLPEDDEVG
jgi:signal transduction histidine kinase